MRAARPRYAADRDHYDDMGRHFQDKATITTSQAEVSVQIKRELMIFDFSISKVVKFHYLEYHNIVKY